MCIHTHTLKKKYTEKKHQHHHHHRPHHHHSNRKFRLTVSFEHSKWCAWCVVQQQQKILTHTHTLYICVYSSASLQLSTYAKTKLNIIHTIRQRHEFRCKWIISSLVFHSCCTLLSMSLSFFLLLLLSLLFFRFIFTIKFHIEPISFYVCFFHRRDNLCKFLI